MFHATVGIANPHDISRSFEERFWVDTVAFYTSIPEDRLQELGIAPARSRDLIFADGSVEHRLLGEARITIAELGESATCPVVFAPAGSPYLLGTTALSAFGVRADPTTRQLKPAV